MSSQESAIDARLDELLTNEFRSTAIVYHPYVSDTVDIYKQRTKTFGTPVTIRGRAIHRPTPEQISVIGNGERYEVAFLFSRRELIRRFPSAADGEWVSTDGEVAWFNRRYKIEKVQATGQVSTHFLMVVVLANTIQGHRDP
jgi:hypothetical protein